MSDKKKLNDEQLNRTNGGIDLPIGDEIRIRGNSGDRKKDNDPNNSMYKVGMWVELYTTFLPITAGQKQIEECKFDTCGNCWLYSFYGVTDGNGGKLWLSADAIQYSTGI